MESKVGWNRRPVPGATPRSPPPPAMQCVCSSFRLALLSTLNVKRILVRLVFIDESVKVTAVLLIQECRSVEKGARQESALKILHTRRIWMFDPKLTYSDAARECSLRCIWKILFSFE